MSITIKKLVDNRPAGNLLLSSDLKYSSKEDIAAAGYCIYVLTTPEVNDDNTKEYILGEDVDKGNNVWHQSWDLVDISFNSDDERQSALNLNISIQWDKIKDIRNYELSRTDWMANSDVEMPDDVMEYRQALRDITEQENPFNIIWPNDPLNLP